MKQLRKAIVLYAVIAMVALCIVPAEANADAPSDLVLFDMGNGRTIWAKSSAGVTVGAMLEATAEANGMTYDYSGGAVTLDGKSTITIGTGTSTGGSFTHEGTTDVVVTSQWNLYKWNSGQWQSLALSSLADAYSAGDVYALGFYPSEIVPNETPAYRDSWTMVRGDAEQTGNQTTEQTTTTEPGCKWMGTENGVYSTILSVQGYVFVKYGAGSGMSEGTDASIVCYKMDGTQVWKFTHPGIMFYEIMSPTIIGDNIYFTSGLGYIFKMPWKEGPGTNNANVTTFNGTAYSESDVRLKIGAIPYEIGALTGTTYSTGSGSLVYDSGVIFCGASNGMVYAFDTNLNLIWSYFTGGCIYTIAPTVDEHYVYMGALNGKLSVLDKTTGQKIVDTIVYQREINEKKYGSVGVVSIVENNSKTYLMFSVTDGRGMNSKVGGLAIYSFNGSALNKILVNTDDYGMVSNYFVRIHTATFNGVGFSGSNEFYMVDTAGKAYKHVSGLPEVHSGPVLVNNERIYLVSYTANKPNYILDTEGHITNVLSNPFRVNDYAMGAPTVIGNYVFIPNDVGMFAYYGEFPVYVPPSHSEDSQWKTVGTIVASVFIALVAIYCVMRFAFHIQKPVAFVAERYRYYVKGDDFSYNTKSKHRLWIVLLIGTVLTIVMFILCLCIGSGEILSVGQMLDALFSAIGKGGKNLTYEELLVYNGRLPRTIAAFAVGVGLSIAGAMYQAIIRNPLVDPYIMGVSSGAGTAAVAVIAFDFTFFGLFSSHSVFLIAASAMVGGVVAFACTLLIANKAGGTSTNYVLAGVVVGLAFSAVQTLMLSMAANHTTSALSWLFGSFSGITWSDVAIVVFPALTLSFVPFLWAKEFNLILLGEDQARQLGLDVKKFNRLMLIIASVLTSVCVAFCGIIGFVGLVVPHLCRMILGGDHRLVLPVSVTFGGALLLFADLLSRMVLVGQELPVGAITTIIGVPVFAYLLIKRGKMYDG